MSHAHYCPIAGIGSVAEEEPKGAWRCRSCTRAFVVTKETSA